MISKNFLMLATLSTLLSTTAFGAAKGDCVGGVCFVKLGTLQPLLKKPRYIKKDLIDKSMTIVLDGEMITVFPKSSYVMNEEEAMDFILLAEPIKAAEDKILEKTNLPSSEYFCEKDKQAVYLNNDIYECV